MAKDYNKDLDQSDGDKRREVARSEGRGREKAPEGDAETAREKAGEGFKNAGDEYAESGSKGAGYRESSGNKK